MKQLILLLLIAAPSFIYGQMEAIKNNHKIYLKGVLKSDDAIYQSPSKSSGVVQRKNEFEFVFLFPTASGGKTENGFYHVGLEPTKPLGWIEATKIAEWDNRICLRFSPLVGRKPALIWNEGDIESVVRGSMDSYDSNGVPNQNAIAQEPGDLSNKRYAMLLPVLEKKSISTQGQLKKAYKVGFLSGGKKQTQSVQRPRSGPAALLEVVFLLDGTASMDPYILGAKEVIASTAKRIQGMNESGVRVGVTVYRDYIQNQPAMGKVTEVIQPLTRNIGEAFTSLEGVRAAEVGSENYPEAGFDGLYAATTETKWNTTKSSLRCIIWIGDASAHPAGDDKNPLNYSLNQIKKTCSKSRVRIIGIKIKSYDEDDNPIHRNQMQSLTQGQTAGDRGYFSEVEMSENVSSDYINKLAASIEEELGRMKQLANATTNTGGSGNSSAISTITVDPTSKAILLKNLKVTAGQKQTRAFSEGWVRELSEAQNVGIVNEHVYMSKDDLDLAITYLSGSLTMVESPKGQIVSTFRQLLQTQTGDKIEANQNLVDHYEKRFGLPATSTLLKFSLEEIEGMGDQRLKRLTDQIKSKLNLLRAHKDNPDNWFEISGSSLKYTFVPLNQLP